MSLITGARLGAYEIVGPIGTGGMGEVYRARDTTLNRDVAIKVLSPSFAADADRLRRFEQEARTAGALNHPNLVTIFELGLTTGAPFIVMELVDGETLRRRLSPDGAASQALPIRKAIDFAMQIAHGLAAAHEHGIVHRDLKPENVIVTPDGRLKILDFGLAKAVGPVQAGTIDRDVVRAAGGAETKIADGTSPGSTSPAPRAHRRSRSMPAPVMWAPRRLPSIPANQAAWCRPGGGAPGSCSHASRGAKSLGPLRRRSDNQRCVGVGRVRCRAG